MNIINLYRVAHWLFTKKIPLFPKLCYYLQFLIFNSSVPYKCKIGKDTRFAYGGIGVVIHSRTEIGENCLIGQGVTIGGKANLHKAPKIGNFVYIAAGSRIIGDITIGNNVVIGVNSVVTKIVPDNCVVAGIPAKIIKRDIDIMNYMDL